MSDDFAVPNPGANPNDTPPELPREPFPVARLVYAVLFALVASVVFWIPIFLAVLQFATVAIEGQRNEELKHFSRRISRYMQEMFDYIMLSEDARPFPLGPFPKE